MVRVKMVEEKEGEWPEKGTAEPAPIKDGTVLEYCPYCGSKTDRGPTKSVCPLHGELMVDVDWEEITYREMSEIETSIENIVRWSEQKHDGFSGDEIDSLMQIRGWIAEMIPNEYE